MSAIYDPIILLPTDFDKAAEWADCARAQEALAQNPDSFGAAMGADPGICHCPACRAYHWRLGDVHKCTQCGFVYPCNAWAMFSWGTADNARSHNQRMKHPYYRYAVENNKVTWHPNVWNVYHSIDWRAAVGDFPLDTELARL